MEKKKKIRKFLKKGNVYLACKGCGTVYVKTHPSFNSCPECLCCYNVELNSLRRPHGGIWYVGASRLDDVIIEQHRVWKTAGIRGIMSANMVIKKIEKYMEVK